MNVPNGTKYVVMSPDLKKAVFKDKSGSVIGEAPYEEGYMFQVACDDSHILWCECHTEGVVVQMYDDETDDLAYLSVMRMYGACPLGWWDRVRYACQILREGRPYGDQLCMGPGALRALVGVLNNAISVLDTRRKKIDAKNLEAAKARKEGDGQ